MQRVQRWFRRSSIPRFRCRSLQVKTFNQQVAEYDKLVQPLPAKVKDVKARGSRICLSQLGSRLAHVFGQVCLHLGTRVLPPVTLTCLQSGYIRSWNCPRTCVFIQRIAGISELNCTTACASFQSINLSQSCWSERSSGTPKKEAQKYKLSVPMKALSAFQDKGVALAALTALGLLAPLALVLVACLTAPWARGDGMEPQKRRMLP